MKRDAILFLLISAAVVLLLIRYHPVETREYRYSFVSMGNVPFNVYVKGLKDPRRSFELARSIVEEFNSLYSDYDPNSLLSRVSGTSEPVELPREFFALLKSSKRAWEKSGGLFDPTVKPLVDLWRRCAAESREPTPEELSEARERVGMGAVELLPGSRANLHGRKLDFGGIAKGYLAQKIATIVLKECGPTKRYRVVVDCGGDLFVSSTETTRVAVRDPFDTSSTMDLLVELPPGDFAVVTSGDYERFFVVNGKRYSHIINPLTGRPEERITSVTVVGKRGDLADAYATALSIGGEALAKKLCEEGELLAVLLVYKTGEREVVGEQSFFVTRATR